MSKTASRSRTAVWIAVVLILLGLGLSSGNFRELLTEAVRGISPMAVLVTLPAQLAAMLICALALLVLRPGANFRACLLSRMLRDGANSLPVSLPGLGEAIGARSLGLDGGNMRAAIAASALDKVAEGIAQIPFVAFAAWILWQGWSDRPFHFGDFVWIVMLGLALVAAALLVLKLGANWGPVKRLLEELRMIVAEARQRSTAMPMSILLHAIAWCSGGVQLWLAGRVLGYDIDFYDGLALESAAYAGRSLAFMVPAGLGAQEGGMVAAGLVLGLTAPQALSLALIFRIRDMIFALPLLAWPLTEYRHQRGKAEKT